MPEPPVVNYSPSPTYQTIEGETVQLLTEILAELRKLTAVPDADVSFADPPKQKIVERAYGQSSQ